MKLAPAVPGQALSIFLGQWDCDLRRAPQRKVRLTNVTT